MDRYKIFNGVAPAMPKPGKGTEVVEFLLSKASRDMREALLPMVFPAMATYLSAVRFKSEREKNLQSEKKNSPTGQ